VATFKGTLAGCGKKNAHQPPNQTTEPHSHQQKCSHKGQPSPLKCSFINSFFATHEPFPSKKKMVKNCCCRVKSTRRRFKVRRLHNYFLAKNTTKYLFSEFSTILTYNLVIPGTLPIVDTNSFNSGKVSLFHRKQRL